jgi:hypothetical protein
MKPSRDLLARARRSYELARLRRGLAAAAIVVPMAIVSLGGCGHRETAIAIAAALAILAAVLVWRGGVGGRGVWPGLVAGVVPLGFPLLACPLCERLGAAHLPMLVCVAGGVVSGAIIAAYAAREPKDRARFVVSSGLVAALAGSMGCAILGLGGIVAMAVGLALTTPVALAVAPRPAGG